MSFFLYLIYGIFWVAFKSVFPFPGDLLLLVVIYLGFSEEKWWRGCLLSLFWGLFLDVVSLSPVGLNITAYLLLFLFIRFLRTKILFQSPLARFYWIFFLMGLYEGMVLFLQTGFAKPRAIDSLLPQFLWEVVWTSFFGMFLPMRERQNN